MKIKIMGQVWTYRFLSKANFRKVHGTEASGICDPSNRHMAFVVPHTDMSLIRHEVRHAYTVECCVDSAHLSGLQMEEVQCELDENHWDNMNKTVKKIHAAFRKRYG